MYVGTKLSLVIYQVKFTGLRTKTSVLGPFKKNKQVFLDRSKTNTSVLVPVEILKLAETFQLNWITYVTNNMMNILLVYWTV